MEPKVRTTRHVETVAAPPEKVYAFIADIRRWPLVFGPTVAVDRLGGDDEQELVRIWAFARGELRDWISRRVLDPAGLRVGFRQLVTSMPVASMGGEWRVLPHRAGSLVVLDHDYSADDEIGAQWIEDAVNTNSVAELKALREAVEAPGGPAESLLTFEDQDEVDGDPAAVYAALTDVAEWPRFLRRSAGVELRELAPGAQHMVTHVQGLDGTVSSTAWVRVCTPPRQIAYKQLSQSPLLKAHVGRWIVTGTARGGAVVTSQHSCLIDRDATTSLLGRQSTVDDARTTVRRLLRGDSSAVLAAVRSRAERTGSRVGS